MRKVIFIVLSVIALRAFPQNGKAVFNDTILHTLYIETDLVHWFDTLQQDFQNNFTNPDQYPEIYRKCKVTWDGTVLNDCGFREKGNASNTLTQFGRKKPFKISFDEFANQQLDGLKKINLNNFINDPSLMHDVTCLKLFRDAGLTASRTSYTKLWINGAVSYTHLIGEDKDRVIERATICKAGALCKDFEYLQDYAK